MSLFPSLLLVAAATLLNASRAGAAAVSFTFDNLSQDGFTGTGNLLSNPGSGGNTSGGGVGDGYLRVTDNAGGNNILNVPVLGSRLDLDAPGLTIGFSVLRIQGTASIPEFGTVTLAGGGFTASLDLVPAGQPTSFNTWTAYSSPFTASAFGVSQGNWRAILSNLTSFSIVYEFTSGVGAEVIGLDNFAIVPEPGAVTFLPMAGLLPVGLLLLRHRRQECSSKG